MASNRYSTNSDHQKLKTPHLLRVTVKMTGTGDKQATHSGLALLYLWHKGLQGVPEGWDKTRNTVQTLYSTEHR